MESKAATHEEIWDDSALVDSWNEALEEYKKYHSIHARGGTVDDIIQDDAEAMTRRDVNAKPETGDAGEPIADEGAGEAEEGEVDETIPMDESDETSHPAISDGLGSVAAKKVITQAFTRASNKGSNRRLKARKVPDSSSALW
ncbi:hypothetical protein NEMBOFW57_004367 [Staphylotrichum longicolle]|uniref:Survival Motor Neuron Gemin2-binding domain-containing protein n=1 Tax=Staphylotrichum longicolle TaxID=669026 RepID=A0AAD4F6P2_9PEZI|nr:hypothetical protein NEMBOFW57_004367 [Staphylotrichum longicolle]